jgi:antitoxin PrlF
MKSDSVISERGQITLPKELRDRYGLVPGTKVSFCRSPRGVLIQKEKKGVQAVHEVYGIIKDDVETDDYLDLTRGKVE